METRNLPWFEWKGVRNDQYGLVVCTLPDISTRPLERTESATIPGRSGSLTLTEGTDIYDNVAQACTCLLEEPYKTVNGVEVDQIAKISSWLKGRGTIRFSNRKEGFRYGRVANQISFSKVLRGHEHRSFSIQFQCDPFFYLDSGNTSFTINKDSPTNTITNAGNIPSLPLIKVTGTGEGAIMCGGSTMLIDDFSGINYIMLDCEAKLAYKGSKGSATDPLTLLGTRVSGDWLTIPEGTSIMSISGSISSIEVTPRWRCI